ncbi:MAG: hypothetical protein QM564_09060 [Bergeyella sp.]
MKNTLYTIFALAIGSLAYGQVGINTENPQGIFNIDAGRDNPSTGSAHTAAQQLNDVIVLDGGNVGIGTISPTQKFEIQTGGTSATPVTGFKLVDGNQNDKYVLTSDADGVGTWKPVGTSYIMGTHISNTLNIPFVHQGYDYWLSTGSYVTLPPGVWKVDVTELLGGYTDNATYLTSDDWMWFRFSFSDEADAATVGYHPVGTSGDVLTDDFVTLNTAGTLVSGAPQYLSTNYDGPRVASPTRYAVANGYFLIRNNTTANKTYYLMANPALTPSTGKSDFYFKNVGSSGWGENRIIASSINLTN